jgi:hypothetical protein
MIPERLLSGIGLIRRNNMVSGALKQGVGGSLPEDVQKEVSRIGDLAKALQSNELKSPENRMTHLLELRHETIRLSILKNFDKLDGKTLSVLYLLKTVLNDYWRNLGGDASFGFEKVLEELPSETVAFSKNIGRFVYLSLVLNNNDEAAMKALFNSIASYYSCLSHMRAKGEQIYTKTKK